MADRMSCPECGRDLALTRGGVRIPPHNPGRSDARTREDGKCAGSRTRADGQAEEV